jgi:peptide subunit release factor 1 (eRF1)
MSTALAPDTRDALLAELRRRTTAPGYHYLSTEHLQRLNELRSADAPVVSLYLRLTGEMRINHSWEIHFKDLRDRALAQAGDHTEAVRYELGRIEAALRAGLPRTGRGLVFFACEGLGLFDQLGTALDLPTEVHLAPEPHVRPLARVRDENDRFVLALVSALKTRFFFAQIGLVEEIYELDGEELALTDYASKDQRQDRRAELKRAQAHRSAHAASLIVQSLDARHLIYSASPDLERDFLDGLDQPTRQRVAASFACDINASTPEVAQAAEAVQREVEAREELATIGQIDQLLSSRAVAGLDQTLDMLNQQRVMTLVVDDDLRLSGGVDTSSTMLTASTGGTFPATGGEIEPVGDLVEYMLDRAMAQGASLELVRSDAAKDALRKHGTAAAILRF